tara:strand:+ start:1672 stop:1863 length:192 start_codon:yes stop_codon:yes gene_type:complete
MRRGKPRPISVVPSPCVKVCTYSTLPGAVYCTACKRTSAEIREWIIMTDEQKTAVLERINEQR